MQMVPVKSSSIKAVGYDNGTMRILFRNGGLYDHPATPAQHESLLAAKSIGAHYSKHHGKSGKKVTR